MSLGPNTAEEAAIPVDEVDLLIRGFGTALVCSPVFLILASGYLF